MFKYVILLAVLCCAGCQTTVTTGARRMPAANAPRGEKLSLRVEKYAGIYDVEVQRAVLIKDEEGNETWTVVSAPRVSGYPEKWRFTDGSGDLNNVSAITAFLLDGEMVGLSLDPGTHLAAKVFPERQNTARVTGIFSESNLTDQGMQVLSVPFDISSTVGELNVIYLKKTDLKAPAATDNE